MGCDILDIRCLFVSELIGSVALAVVLFAVFYFIIASKMKFGFDTTIVLATPILLIFSLAIGGFSIVYAFLTMLSALMIGWLIDKMFGNK